MKKFALALAFLLLLPVTSEASEPKENKVVLSTTDNRRQEEIYEVYEIFADRVTVRFVESIDEDIPANTKSEFSIEKSKFPNTDIKLGDQYRIAHSGVILTSYPGQFGEIYEIEKENKVEIELPEDKNKWSFVHDGKTYKYTGFESGVYQKTWDIEGYIKDPKFSDLPYRKGLTKALLEVYIDGKWEIFSSKNLKEDEVPAGVYNAVYEVNRKEDPHISGMDKRVIMRFVGTDEGIFKSRDKTADIEFEELLSDSFKIGEQYRIWHSLPKADFTDDDFNNYKSVIYKMESLEEYTNDFVVVKIDKDNVFLDDIDRVKSQYKVAKTELKGLDIKVNDILSIKHNGEFSNKAPFTFTKIYSIAKVDGDRNLALSVFINLVKANASTMLLEKTPKSVASIEKDLKASVNDSKGLIDEAFKYFIGKEDLIDRDREEAVLILMRHKYNKKIASKEEKDVALAIFNNIIKADASRTLISASPKTSTSLYWDLVYTLDSSKPLIEEALAFIK